MSESLIKKNSPTNYAPCTGLWLKTCRVRGATSPKNSLGILRIAVPLATMSHSQYVHIYIYAYIYVYMYVFTSLCTIYKYV